VQPLGVVTAESGAGGGRPASDWPEPPEFPADPPTATGRGYFEFAPPLAAAMGRSIAPPDDAGKFVVPLPPFEMTIGSSVESATRALHAVSIPTNANIASRRDALLLELRTASF